MVKRMTCTLRCWEPLPDRAAGMMLPGVARLAGLNPKSHWRPPPTVFAVTILAARNPLARGGPIERLYCGDVKGNLSGNFCLPALDICRHSFTGIGSRRRRTEGSGIAQR